LYWAKNKLQKGGFISRLHTKR